MKFYSIFVALLILLSLGVYGKNVAQASEVTEQQVAELYVATFNRAPDAAGLAYWVNSALTIEEIAQSFFDQPETQVLYPADNTHTDFVTSIYSNLFNRAPDAAGLDYWVGALESGAVTRPVMIEAVKNGAQATDAEIVANKAEVGLYYANKGLENYFSLSNVTDDSASVVSAKTAIDALVLTFKVPDTGQVSSFTNTFGEDADYSANTPSYTLNGDGTTTDIITGLLWQNSPDTNGNGTIDADDKMLMSEAQTYCENLTLANRSDWRLPDIKTMYSLINFSGEDVSILTDNDTSGVTPFIDTNYFDFAFGDTDAGERVIDVQYASATSYVSTTMFGDATVFGVNMADGRIKGYNSAKKQLAVQCVCDNESYGTNTFVDNADSTISDSATGLMWEQDDSQTSMDWEAALDYCENRTSAGYSDWRLPNAKELQSILDYTRSPDTSSSAAINAVFNAKSFTNEAGEKDWGYYWTGTTHKSVDGSSENAVYVSFGRALGYMNNQFIDVHGAGAQRSNIKAVASQMNNSYTIVTGADGGDVITHGPQGDVVRTQNCVRCVRD